MQLRRYSRGYLPHVDGGQRTQFLTWRLADSLPAEILQQWQLELKSEPSAERKHKLQSRIEAYLDAGHGSQILGNPLAAGVVQSALLYNDQKQYELHGWVVMPNVHALVTPADGVSLGKIMQSLKGYTSKQIQQKLGGDGRLWQPDYFDRWIRDAEHFYRVLNYIEWNPVKAKLCSDPTLWRYGSANSENWK